MDVIDNKAESRFEVRDGEEIARSEYIRQGNTIIFTHTEVPPHFRGRGVAGELTAFALNQARAEGLRVIPKCPFVKSFIEKHPEFESLVSNDGKAR